MSGALSLPQPPRGAIVTLGRYVVRWIDSDISLAGSFIHTTDFGDLDSAMRFRDLVRDMGGSAYLYTCFHMTPTYKLLGEG